MDFVEDPGLIHSALGDQEMEAGVKIYPGAEGLNGGDNPRRKRAPRDHLEIPSQRTESRAAELPEQFPVVLEEGPQHLGDGKDDLAVSDIQKKYISHPLAPLLKPLRVAREAEAAGAAGEHQQPLLPAVRTTDTGKPALWVVAVQIALNDLFDDGTEEPVFFLVPGLIFSKELVKVMKHHPVEHGAFGMPGTIDSCRSKEEYPATKIRSCPSWPGILTMFSSLEFQIGNITRFPIEPVFNPDISHLIVLLNKLSALRIALDLRGLELKVVSRYRFRRKSLIAH